jgi:hypothetical protein
MDSDRRRKALLGLVATQVVIFVVSLPGFGVETRKPTAYAAWAGPIFLVLTVLIFVLGVAAFLFSRGEGPRLARTVLLQAAVAFVINAFDFSGVGGPRPPPGPLALGLLAIVVAVGQVIVVVPLLRPPAELRSAT